MSVLELHSSLIVHEQNYLRFNKTRGEEQVLKTTVQERAPYTTANRGRGGNRGRGRGRQSRDTIECFKCKKLGHYRNECPEWEKEGNINYTEEEEEEEDNELMLLMACTEDDGDELISLRDCTENSDDELMLMMAGTEEKNEEMEQTWFLDSGCSNHMSGNRMSLVTLDTTVKKTVRLGNDMKIQVAGKGNVKVKMNGKAHLIQDVYYIPELKNNLLSIGQLQENGLTVMFEGGKDSCKVYHKDKGLILESKVASNRMYKLIPRGVREKTKSDPKCFLTSVDEITHLWHRRFGHLSKKGLITLQRQNIVRGLPKITNDD